MGHRWSCVAAGHRDHHCVPISLQETGYCLMCVFACVLSFQLWPSLRDLCVWLKSCVTTSRKKNRCEQFGVTTQNVIQSSPLHSPPLSLQPPPPSPHPLQRFFLKEQTNQIYKECCKMALRFVTSILDARK